MSDKTKVAVMRCSDYETEHVLPTIRRIFDVYGGPDKIIKAGGRVLIKPNLIASDKVHTAATTHPAIIDALIRIIRECKAHPFIGDSPAFGSASGVAKACGIKTVAEQHNVPIVRFRANKKISRTTEEGTHLFNRIPQPWQQKVSRLATMTSSINDFDVIINVPKLKAHVQMRFSGAVKNMYGFMQGKAKALRHFDVHNDIELFTLVLLYMYERVRPEFTIVDAIDVMEEKGPRGGVVKRRGILIGGIDCVAVDTVISHLLGKRIDEVPIINYAQKYGCGVTDLGTIDIKGDENTAMTDFKLPSELMQISFSIKTVVKSIVKHLVTLCKETRSDTEPYL